MRRLYHRSIEYLRQRRRRRSNLQKSQRWQNCQSAIHHTSYIELGAVLGKWLARAHGAGLVASVAFLIQAYTSLAGASDHICIAIYFVSDAIVGARGIARFFVTGGALSLVAASMPNIVRIVRTVIADGRNSVNVIEHGKEIYGLRRKNTDLILFTQSLLIIVSTAIFAVCIYGILSSRFFKPADLLVEWAEFEKQCSHSLSPLQMLPIPNPNLRDWPRPTQSGK